MRAGGAPQRRRHGRGLHTDIATARAAGVPVIAVDFGYTEIPVASSGPDRVVSAFADLPEAVFELIGPARRTAANCDPRNLPYRATLLGAYSQHAIGPSAPVRRLHARSPGSYRPRMVAWGQVAAAVQVGTIMSRVIAVTACGFTLAACSSSMPSLDFFKSSPATEALRIESEPPGRRRKDLAGPVLPHALRAHRALRHELTVTVALNGYQPQTVPVRAGGASRDGYGDSGAVQLACSPTRSTWS